MSNSAQNRRTTWFTISRLLVLVCVAVVPSLQSIAEDTLIAAETVADSVIAVDPQMHHLRIASPREWNEFPQEAAGPRLEFTFHVEENQVPQSLRLRQQDVKQRWTISLNNQQLGRLVVDENDMVLYFPIPDGAIIGGANTLRIEQDVRGDAIPDDIYVGDIVVDSRPMTQVLSEATVEIQVVDRDNMQHLPARLTIIDAKGALQSTGAKSNDHLAVRPGIVYTSTGTARMDLPAGQYTVYAGRGFEYSLDSAEVKLAAGQTVKRRLSIRREVPTEGYVACDTHVHTLTYSGHGDASIQERMITLAAEGIELPIATDHNVHVDYRPFAEALRVRRYFTPVMGNEVTTQVGHFNVFPVKVGAKPPNHRLTDWQSIFAEIYRTPDVKVVILNHGRDLHGGTRPLGPKRHNAPVGENLDGWPPGMNAMEVVNSSATQTDVLQLFHDWMGLLNRGRSITPVGSSDSHDVGRHFVGQGRTYIRCDDRDPGNINESWAVNRFIEGRVLVSYGLMVELTINEKYQSGDLVRVSDNSLRVDARVLGPHWVKATRVKLFANGRQIRDEQISTDALGDLPVGVKWNGQWTIAIPKHDVHLVAIATGPGIDLPYWKTAKPYQPTSPDWESHVVGCSGAIWWDVDGDGRRTAAYDYAQRLFAESNGDLDKLIASLSDYDRAVASQVAKLYQASGKSWLTSSARQALQDASAETQAGVRMYVEAWRANQIARSGE